MHKRGRPRASAGLLTSSETLAVKQKERLPLEVIAVELNSALKRETTDIIKIGSLLVEAKAQLSQGQWLPWLAKHLRFSERIAADYIDAYNFAEEILVILRKTETPVDPHQAIPPETQRQRRETQRQWRAEPKFNPPSEQSSPSPEAASSRRFSAAVLELEKLETNLSAKFAGIGM
jgi:Protein of unknown function (DUF3102)